jgi:hypothetical protein
MWLLEIGNDMLVLSRAPANETQQKCGHILQKDGLAHHEQDGDGGIAVTMTRFQFMQPPAQKVQHKKKISEYEDGIDHQLDRKRPERPNRVLFHASVADSSLSEGRPVAVIWSTAKFHCTARPLSVIFSPSQEINIYGRRRK